MSRLRVAPSILAADYAHLADEVAEVADVVTMLHVDVMDGHYVPNITIGPPVVARLRQATDLLLDCHLMITDPVTYAPQFVEVGADSISFHPEVVDDPRTLIDVLHDEGAEVGVALKPAHPLSMVEGLLPHVEMLLVMTVEPGFGGQAFRREVVPKVAEARRWRDTNGASLRIQVDGGIAGDTVAQVALAGADTFVAGSAVFNAPDREAAVRELLSTADEALAGRGVA